MTLGICYTRTTLQTKLDDPYLPCTHTCRCTNGVECWREGLVDVSEGCISDAVHWVRATPVQTTAVNTSVVEALTQALTHNQVSALYCYVKSPTTTDTFR